MARNYREYIAEICPPWLLTWSGKPFVEAFGVMKDALVYRMIEAVRARFPRYATGDALVAIGEERGLPRAPGEPLEAYAIRLARAWEAWHYAGTALGLLRAFYDSGYTNVATAIFNRRLYELDSDRNLVTTELPVGSWLFVSTEDTFWAKFVVIFPTPHIQRWVDDGIPADDSDEANLIRSLIRRWKPAHMICDRIIIQTSGNLLGFPTGQTLGIGTLGSSTATYWEP